MCSVCLVGSSEDELRLRLWLPSVPGRARPLTGGAYALRLVVLSRDLASDGVLVIIVHNIRRGSSPPPSGRHGRSKHQY
jgi:hypothetical protein